MRIKLKKKLVSMIVTIATVASVVAGSTVTSLAVTPDAEVKAQEKSYGQFMNELADAMSKIGDKQVAKIEVQAAPYISLGGKAIRMLEQKKYLVLCVHYQKDGAQKDVVITSEDAALKDANGYLGFEYVFNKHLKDQVKAAEAAGVTLSEGLEPVTWEPSSSELIIKSSEASVLYHKIKDGNYPAVDELKNSNVTKQIDELSSFYKAAFGSTDKINTPEREELRQQIAKKFLSIGSARTQSIDFKTKRHNYVYDGPVSKDYEMELVLGLPASGKSTRVTDPDSEAMKAFILDCDVIKELIPEFQESYGGGADAVHFESMDIMNRTIKEFTEGSLKGTNVIIPIVASDFDELMNTYIKPFEAAGYNVRAKFVPCEENASVSRNIARELETGRIINSFVVFSFGTKPEEVWNKLAPMLNSKGVTYGYGYENQAKGAA